jgi:ferredoxin
MADKRDRTKESWRKRFQIWIDRQMLLYPEEYKCGYGSMCGECDLELDKSPCLKALQRLLKRHEITLDYQKATFEDVWEGIPFNQNPIEVKENG